MKKSSRFEPRPNQPCRGCGLTKPLVKSHIVPESFCKLLSSPKNAARLVRTGEYPTLAPIGAYDSNILCSDCEKKLGIPDDYAFAFLHGGKTNFESIELDQTLVAFATINFDYKKLKLFVLSVLWRASVSKIEFCSLTQLNDKNEERLRQITLCGVEPCEEEFPICCGKIIFDERGGMIPGPFEETREGVKLFRVSTGEFYFWVKVDAKPWPGLLLPMVAKPGEILLFTASEMRDSPESVAAQRIVRLSKKKGVKYPQ
jgi:hypothetical protein